MPPFPFLQHVRCTGYVPYLLMQCVLGALWNPENKSSGVPEIENLQRSFRFLSLSEYLTEGNHWVLVCLEVTFPLNFCEVKRNEVFQLTTGKSV